MAELYWDLETYSTLPLNGGTYAYAQAAQVTLFAWAIDDEPAQVWDVMNGEPMPRRLADAIDALDTQFIGHNVSGFDIPVAYIAEAIQIPIDRSQDTMAKALSVSLPGSLDKLCDILHVDAEHAKDKDGRRLVLLFCKPRAFTAAHVKRLEGEKPKEHKARIAALRESWPGRATRETHPEDWEKFKHYAALDVEATREVYRKLPGWNYRKYELDLWRLDHKINRRGICIDVDFVDAAIATIAEEKERLATLSSELTDGAVPRTTQRDVLLAHILDEYGYKLDDMKSSTVEKMLDDPELPVPLAELLRVRLQATTSSTAKYYRLRGSLSPDGRLRGTLQFCGASRTGRWAGRLFQVQNLPRPSVGREAIEKYIRWVKLGGLSAFVDNPMQALSDSLRGCIIAAPGKKLVLADYSNVEGRGTAWVCGENWKVKAFEAFDAGEGPDLYVASYCRSFGVTPEEMPEWGRQVGKVLELSMGYGGGVAAFVTFALVYGLDLAELVRNARLPDWALDEAESYLDWVYEKNRPRYGLDDKTFVTVEALKRVWRRAHPRTVKFWKYIENAAIDAVRNPGKVIECGPCRLRVTGGWLRIQLPSGRSLSYPEIRIDDEGHLTYEGVNQFNRQWQRLRTWGGKLLENIVQAISRDVMAYHMVGIEEAGYPIITTIHDEIVTEVPDTQKFTAPHLSELMTTELEWCIGFPLAAKGAEVYRYGKT